MHDRNVSSEDQTLHQNRLKEGCVKNLWQDLDMYLYVHLKICPVNTK